jgi:hypothetical protein
MEGFDFNNFSIPDVSSSQFEDSFSPPVEEVDSVNLFSDPDIMRRATEVLGLAHEKVSTMLTDIKAKGPYEYEDQLKNIHTWTPRKSVSSDEFDTVKAAAFIPRLRQGAEAVRQVLTEGGFTAKERNTILSLARVDKSQVEEISAARNYDDYVAKKVSGAPDSIVLCSNLGASTLEYNPTLQQFIAYNESGEKIDYAISANAGKALSVVNSFSSLSLPSSDGERGANPDLLSRFKRGALTWFNSTLWETDKLFSQALAQLLFNRGCGIVVGSDLSSEALPTPKNLAINGELVSQPVYKMVKNWHLSNASVYSVGKKVYKPIVIITNVERYDQYVKRGYIPILVSRETSTNLKDIPTSMSVPQGGNKLVSLPVRSYSFAFSSGGTQAVNYRMCLFPSLKIHASIDGVIGKKYKPFVGVRDGAYKGSVFSSIGTQNMFQVACKFAGDPSHLFPAGGLSHVAFVDRFVLDGGKNPAQYTPLQIREHMAELVRDQKALGRALAAAYYHVRGDLSSYKNQALLLCEVAPVLRIHKLTEYRAKLRKDDVAVTVKSHDPFTPKELTTMATYMAEAYRLPAEDEEIVSGEREERAVMRVGDSSLKKPPVERKSPPEVKRAPVAVEKLRAPISEPVVSKPRNGGGLMNFFSGSGFYGGS